VQQQLQQSGEGSGGSWKDKMNGWFGGDAGLPMDGWLTTCCAQVNATLAAAAAVAAAAMHKPT
jgi:hypothetical protein